METLGKSEAFGLWELCAHFLRSMEYPLSFLREGWVRIVKRFEENEIRVSAENHTAPL